MKRLLNRRTLLRGAGITLALPWMESLAPKAARAQAAVRPKRFIPIFFPNGAAERFRPATAGAGAAWSLSPILEPFAALKSKMVVLTGMENYSAFNDLSMTDAFKVEPSHGRQPQAFLRSVDGEVVSQAGATGGISVDQVIAQSPDYAAMPLPSMQVGASSRESFCDNRPCEFSRSISWRSGTQPMYKDVDPLTIFNQIVGVVQPPNPNPMPGPDAEKYAAIEKSVLDGVLESATRVRAQMGTSDQSRMDEFLESVRAVEKKATAVSNGITNLNCQQITAPTLYAEPNLTEKNTETYNKGDHVSVINDLIVMALQCDVTRVISYMLEDERSEFIYSHVPRRVFSETTSTAGGGDTCGEYHGSQHAGAADDGFASINWWQSSKVAELCAKLDAIPEGDGVTLLDNSLILYGSCMHGSNHNCDDLPVALIGGASGTFVMDQHIQFPAYPNDRPMRDLHLTILNHYFGLAQESFGVGLKGTPNQVITELMA
ncbi:MAG TPA: DUF1552 domain-containing protein [Polyangiaceae bacterium]|nr:DUF1552 domain-containing protein [Polyangiaceae bacterium]